MPPLSFTVSDLQQRTANAKVSDLNLANAALRLANEMVDQGQKLRFPVFPDLDDPDSKTAVSMHLRERQTSRNKRLSKQQGVGAVSDASIVS